MLLQVVRRESAALGVNSLWRCSPFLIQTLPWWFLFLLCHLTVPVSSAPRSAAMTHGAFAAQSRRTPFSISSIQLKCFTIFLFYLVFVIGFPVSQFSWQQRGGGNDSKYLIKIKCYDLISAERILSRLYEAFEKVPKSRAQSDCGPVIPSGHSKALKNSRYHEIRKIKITVCTNCMEDQEETICEQWQD